jgi:hypothetical protein
MNKLILFQIILFALLIVALISGIVSLFRLGQVFLGIGILDLVISVAALLGWPMLRGDISNQAQFSRQNLQRRLITSKLAR